jgi:hypothetical protein
VVLLSFVAKEPVVTVGYLKRQHCSPVARPGRVTTLLLDFNQLHAVPLGVSPANLPSLQVREDSCDEGGGGYEIQGNSSGQRKTISCVLAPQST